MGGKTFINYRRDDSIGMAGRLHDRLAQVFGRDKLFMDVDHIPAGTDFVAHLNSQVAECDVVLVVIGANWLGAKDESGGRRLDNPDDFVAIEIGAALARNIRVIPVLVDGARMPKASELPDPLKPLSRRHAVDVRHAHFGHDAEALIARMREALGDDAAGRRRWRLRAAIGATVVAVLLLIGWAGHAYLQHMLMTVEQTAQRRETELRAELERQARAVTEAEAKRKAEEAEQQRLAAVQAEQERAAKAAAEAEAKRRDEEAEQRRLAAAKAEQERLAKVAAEAEARRREEEAEQRRSAAAKAEQERLAKVAAEAEARRREEAEQRRLAAVKAEREQQARADARARATNLMYSDSSDDSAIAAYNEAVRLDPDFARGFLARGLAYGKRGDLDRALADFNETIRLDPKTAFYFYSRGLTYDLKGDIDRAVADYDEAIRLDPGFDRAFLQRGILYGKKSDLDRAIADLDKATQLAPQLALAFNARGAMYTLKRDDGRAIADFSEAIRLDPKFALAFCNRGQAKLRVNVSSGNADIAEARRLNGSICQ